VHSRYALLYLKTAVIQQKW